MAVHLTLHQYPIALQHTTHTHEESLSRWGWSHSSVVKNTAVPAEAQGSVPSIHHTVLTATLSSVPGAY